METKVKSKINIFVEEDIKKLTESKRTDLVKNLRKKESKPAIIYLTIALLMGLVSLALYLFLDKDNFFGFSV